MSSGLAVHHADLRQSNTTFSEVLSRVKANPYSYVGQAAFNNAFGFTDRPAQAPGDTVTLLGFDAANDAGGSVQGLRGPVRHSPRSPVTGYSSAPIGESNGSHSSSSQQGATSRLPASGKSSRLELMKETQRRLG